jgi:plastocyanin
MSTIRRRRLTATAFASVAGLLSGCGQSASVSTPATAAKAVSAKPVFKGPAMAAIDIPGEDRFAPFVTSVAPNGTITVKNSDTDEHTVTNLPGALVQFDVHIKGGETQTFTLPAGTYRYYCTIHAKYVPDTGQVAALPTAGFPDEPMEGLITAG